MEKEKKFFKERKTATVILMLSKFGFFAAFIWTAFIMLKMGANKQDIFNILYTAVLFIILNKLDKE